MSGTRGGPLIPASATSALTVAVGLVGGGRPSYWYDEAASLSAAGRPLPDLLDLVRSIDLVHLAYYLVLHGWLEVVGSGEAAVRSLSALALGLGCAGLVVLADRVADRWSAWLAGLVFALLPGLTWLGTEARAGAFVVVGACWSMVALDRALERGRARDWAVLVVLSILTVSFSVIAVLVVVPQLWWASRRGRPRLLPFLIAWLVVVAFSAPLLWATFAQRSQVAYIRLSTHDLVVGVLLDQLFEGTQNRGLAGWQLAGAALALLAVVAGARAVLARDSLGSAARLGAVWAIVPTLLVALPVLVGVRFYQQRYLVFAAPGACLVVAVGLRLLWVDGRSRGWVRGVTAVLVAAALVGSVFSIAAQRRPDAKSGDDYRRLAAAGRGADHVYWSADDARGIAVAYPRDLAGATDPLLRQGAVEADTLFGVGHVLRGLRPRGDVVAYVRVDELSGPRAHLLRTLEAAGCERGTTTRASRWSAVRLRCPGRPPR